MTEITATQPDPRYADKKWRAVGPKRAMDAAQRVYEEVCQDILDYDDRLAESKQMAQDAYEALCERVRVYMRNLFHHEKVQDAAELKRRAREFAGLPKRIHKKT